jgi:hypothetical protein
MGREEREKQQHSDHLMLKQAATTLHYMSVEEASSHHFLLTNIYPAAEQSVQQTKMS